MTHGVTILPVGFTKPIVADMTCTEAPDMFPRFQFVAQMCEAQLLADDGRFLPPGEMVIKNLVGGL